MKPVLKYRGGKLREIPRFEKYIPATYRTYIEPFLGGGAVYFHLAPKKAIVNDLNARLMAFYRELKSDYPTMRQQLDTLQNVYEQNQALYRVMKARNPDERVPNKNETLYYHLRNLYNHPNHRYLDSVIYFFINKTAYSGMIRYNKEGEYNVPFGRYQNFNTKLITEDHHRLLERTDIYNTDYQNIFNLATAEDFMFLDPPYDCVFNDYGNLEKENGFDENEHRRLASDFKNLSCRALMVVGKTPLTMELYGKYVVDEYHKTYAVNIRNRFKNDKMHLVVKNF